MLSALPLLPLSSLVIKAAGGREKLTHYDLHKNLIPGWRRIPAMQKGSGARFALPWQATGLWYGGHVIWRTTRGSAGLRQLRFAIRFF